MITWEHSFFRISVFYCTNAPDEGFIGEVKQLGNVANVRLHVLVSGKGPRLTGGHLRETVPAWASANVWFCGPDGFGRSLQEDLVASGLSAQDFHRELFATR